MGPSTALFERDEPSAPLSNSARAMKKNWKSVAGFSLTELVCVMAIIAILMSLYLPVIVKTFSKVLKFLKQF